VVLVGAFVGALEGFAVVMDAFVSALDGVVVVTDGSCVGTDDGPAVVSTLVVVGALVDDTLAVVGDVLEGLADNGVLVALDNGLPVGELFVGALEGLAEADSPLVGTLEGLEVAGALVDTPLKGLAVVAACVGALE
jgi:hypothetical protein